VSSFNKQETVAFEKLIVGFKDLNIASNLVNEYNIDPLTVARSQRSGVVRPMPYIVRSFTGTDMTGNFTANTQLGVPVAINTQRSVPIAFDANELIDDLQFERLVMAAKQKLASDIEGDVLNLLVNQGTRVIKRTTSATGFDDTIAASALLDDVGVQYDNRYFLYNVTDYQNAASNLAGRSNFMDAVKTAYTDGNVTKMVNGFNAYSVPRMPALAAATATSVTVNGANQFYTPVAVTNGLNVDNRYQNINITVGGSTVKVGDCFTIAGVNSVHFYTKSDTGLLQTFRVISGAGTANLRISPQIVATGAYQNCSAAAASGAALTFMNTVSKPVNPFWVDGAVVLSAGQLAFPNDGEGVKVMTSTSKNGIPLYLVSWFDGNKGKQVVRFTTMYGTTVLNPELCGVIIAGQT